MKFWDEPTQEIRIGSDLDECFFTRNIPLQSKVTEDKALVVIDATDQFSWLTINGEVIVVTRKLGLDSGTSTSEQRIFAGILRIEKLVKS